MYRINLRCFFLLAFIGLSCPAFSQLGYVKLIEGDSVVPGYMRHYVTDAGEEGWEVWKTKRDKHPHRIVKSAITEFAIKKDTFKIIRGWKPFPDRNLYFKYVEAIAVSRGKVNLYVVPNFKKRPNRVLYDMRVVVDIASHPGFSTATAAIIALIGKTDLYIWEDVKTLELTAIPRNAEKRIQTLKEFLPGNYVDLYARGHGQISNRMIPALVKQYNWKGIRSK